MKARNLTVLAVVATGALALAAPSAFAVDAQVAKKSKSDSRQDKDIKRLSENVNSLRKADDETNGRITSIVEGLSPVLSQLSSVAKSYTNFQYGFVQLSFGNLQRYVGNDVQQGFFTVTPRLDPTQQQATVTKQFVLPSTWAVKGWTGGALRARVGVRSAQDPQTLDNGSTAFCGITVSVNRGTPGNALANAGYAFSLPNADLPDTAPLPFYPIQRSPLQPKASQEELFSLVGEVGSDKVIDLLDPSRASTAVSGPVNVQAGDNVTVGLSCLAVDNQKLKDADITPPFAES